MLDNTSEYVPGTEREIARPLVLVCIYVCLR